MKLTTSPAKRPLSRGYALLKIISAVLAVLLLSSCGKGGEEGEGQKPDTGRKPSAEINMPYKSDDVLTPYEAQSLVNAAVCEVVFEPLFHVNEKLEAVPCLASGFTSEQNTVTVSLSNAVFSDGNRISPADVIYSFDKCKESVSYKTVSEAFSSCEALGDSVRFTLTEPTIRPENLLTFPIVEKSSGLGTGPYVFADDGTALTQNQKYRAASGDIAKINLIESAQTENMLSELTLGSISLFPYRLSSMTLSGLFPDRIKIPSQNLTVLALNTDCGYLQNADFRRGINKAVNHRELAQSVYGGLAETAYFPVAPQCGDFLSADLETATLSLDLDGAEKLLSPYGDVTLSLAVSDLNEYSKNAAEAVKAALARVGITVSINTLSAEDFAENVQYGYDMFICSVRLPANGDITEVFDLLGNCGCEESRTAWESYKNGGGIQDFINAYELELPFVTLCMRDDTVILTGKLDASGADIYIDSFYAGITAWKSED